MFFFFLCVVFVGREGPGHGDRGLPLSKSRLGRLSSRGAVRPHVVHLQFDAIRNTILDSWIGKRIGWEVGLSLIENNQRLIKVPSH